MNKISFNKINLPVIKNRETAPKKEITRSNLDEVCTSDVSYAVYLQGLSQISFKGVNESSVQKRVEYLTKGGFKLDERDAKEVAELDDIGYKKAIELLEQGVKKRTAKIALMDEKDQKIAVRLANMGIPSNIVGLVLKLGENKALEFEGYFKRGFSASVAYEMVKTGDFSEESINEFINKGYHPNVAYYASMLDDKTREDMQAQLDLLNNLYFDEYTEDEIDELIKDKIQDKEYMKRAAALYELGNTHLKNIAITSSDEVRFNETYKKALKLNSEIDRLIPDNNFDKREKHFLRLFAFNNKYHTPDEYIKAYCYLKDLKTDEGEPILNSAKVVDKVVLEGKKRESAKTSILFNNISEILNMNPSSIEASYVEMLLDLIKKGVVHTGAICVLSSGDNEKEGVNIKSSWEISPFAKQDIDKLYEVYISSDGSKEAIKDAFIPEFETDEDAVCSIKTGEVYQLKGEKYIKIKTDDNSIEQLYITKDTYFELFPPVNRFVSSQQTFGDCYSIEALMSIYDDDKARYALLKTMKEEENGDITIKLRSFDPVTFKNGKLPECEDIKRYASGAYGFRLFEYAVAKGNLQSKIENTKASLTPEKRAEFDKFLEENGDNIFIYKDAGETKWVTYDEAMRRNFNLNKDNNKVKYDSYLNYNYGNGGPSRDVYYEFGLPISYVTFKLKGNLPALDEMLEKAKDIAYFDENILQVDMDMHSYSIRAEQKNGKMRYILYNPHSQGMPLIFDDLSVLKKDIEAMTLIEKKPQKF